MTEEAPHAGGSARSGSGSRRRALGPLLASLALLGMALYLGHATASLQLNGLHASGTVTALRLSSSKNYNPRVRFKTTFGDIIEFEGKGANPPEHRVGDAVDVVYAADRPTQAIIDRGVRNWILPALLGLFASAIAVVSARALIRA